MEIVKRAFGTTKDDKDISCYTITNEKGMSVTVSELGAIIIGVTVPDKNGKKLDVVLGYDDSDPYYGNDEFFGATIGRSANRIQGASFDIDGTKIQLPVNENSNNLHSDSENGFHKKLWTAAPDEARNAVTMSYTSPDGENGFPGNLDMHVTFALSDDNEFSIHYEGVSDKKTLINCTNHSYFNLAGHSSGKILDHYLKINASKYTPVEPDSIPTGEIADVEGTPFDFREFHKIGERITAFGSSPKAVLSFELCPSAIGAGRQLIRLVVERQRLAALPAGVLSRAGLFSCFRHTITSAKNSCYYYSQKNSNNTSSPFFCGELYDLSIIILRSLLLRSRPMQT